MFSLSVVLSSSSSSARSSTAASPSRPPAAASASTRSTNSADLATKSVSQRSSTMAAAPSRPADGHRALGRLAVGPLGRPARPCSRSHSWPCPCRRRSPPGRAWRRASRPVAWRSVWTSLAEKSGTAQASSVGVASAPADRCSVGGASVGGRLGRRPRGAAAAAGAHGAVGGGGARRRPRRRRRRARGRRPPAPSPRRGGGRRRGCGSEAAGVAGPARGRRAGADGGGGRRRRALLGDAPPLDHGVGHHPAHEGARSGWRRRCPGSRR